MELQDVQVFADGLAFPEGPVAMADGSLIFGEVRAGRVSRCDANHHVSLVAEVGGGPNGVAMGPDGVLFVANRGDRGDDAKCPPCIQTVDPNTGKVDVLYTEVDGVALASPNDLVFDSTGHFWFTDFGTGEIFYAAADGSQITRAITGLANPNGIGLSPDGTVLYWAQTLVRQVLRRKLSAPGQVIASPGCTIGVLMTTGSIDPEGLLVGLPGYQELDSLAIDSSGAVCVGTLTDSGITVIPADGGPIQKLTFPEHLNDGAFTNICFGGPDMQTAYVTASMTGRVLTFRWPRPGLRLAYQA
jgi:gluconolactonase